MPHKPYCEKQITRESPKALTPPYLHPSLMQTPFHSHLACLILPGSHSNPSPSVLSPVPPVCISSSCGSWDTLIIPASPVPIRPHSPAFPSHSVSHHRQNESFPWSCLFLYSTTQSVRKFSNYWPMSLSNSTDCEILRGRKHILPNSGSPPPEEFNLYLMREGIHILGSL